MAAPGAAPIQVPLDAVPGSVGTDEVLSALLRINPRVSDLIFSPGRRVQVQVNGEFVPVGMPGTPALTADDTRRIASDLIGSNKAAVNLLREQGYCDVSYAIPGLARFRVNVFIQRGSCAVVMRVIATAIPTFASLTLPDELRAVASLRDGLVLVTGPRGSGKTSTLAALIDCINESVTCHIITIEDPIEYLHNHKRATVHQRELHSDTPTVAHAMRAALRQAPNVIAVGELSDNESVNLALEAAETGHLVLSTLNTTNLHQTFERLVSAFPAAEQSSVRDRLGRMLRYVIAQRLIPRKSDTGRIGIFEVIKSGSTTLDRVLESRDDFAVAGNFESGLDGEIAKLLHSGVISQDTALSFAIHPRELPAKLSALQQ